MTLAEAVEVNTVDAFQGREKDMIIFNCVRSNCHLNIQSSLGFLMDERRLNVAITRPRHFLIVVGNTSTLVKSDTWRNLVNTCRDNQTLVELRVRDMHDPDIGIGSIIEKMRLNSSKDEKIEL